MKMSAASLFVLTVFCFVASAAPAKTYVAIWTREDEAAGGAEYILPLAEVDQGEWKAAIAPVKPQVWTVSFDGKKIGTCKSKASGPIGNDFKNAHRPVDKMPHPGKSNRPLVLISKPNFKDPDEWKPATLLPQERNQLIAQFRRKFPKADNCEKFEKDEKHHAESYLDDDLKFDKVYASNKKSYVVRVHLEKWGCDAIFDEPFEYQTFAINPNGEVKYLSKRLELIDAGDYDGSGNSKLVFRDDSDGGDDDNSRGYSIWSENFVLLAKRFRTLH